MAARMSDRHLENGPMVPVLLSFALPVLLLQELFNVTDCTVVGHFDGDCALAATGVAGLAPSLASPLLLRLFTKDVAMFNTREADYLESDVDGLWIPAVKANAPVKAGDLLGTVYDFYGESIREVRAERDGHVLYVNTALSSPVGEFQVAVAWADSEVKL